MRFLDSGCSRYMTGDIFPFVEFMLNKKGYVTYKDNNSGLILDKGSKRLLIVEEPVHVTFEESYPRNVGKDISFYDAGVSSEDILKDAEKGIDQPEAVKPEKKEDVDPEKEKEESPTKVDDLPLARRTSKDHLIDKILRYITKDVTTCSKISNFVITLHLCLKLNLKMQKKP